MAYNSENTLTCITFFKIVLMLLRLRGCVCVLLHTWKAGSLLLPLHGFCVLNSCGQACTACALPTEPSQQPCMHYHNEHREQERKRLLCSFFQTQILGFQEVKWPMDNHMIESPVSQDRYNDSVWYDREEASLELELLLLIGPRSPRLYGETEKSQRPHVCQCPLYLHIRSR